MYLNIICLHTVVFFAYTAGLEWWVRGKDFPKLNRFVLANYFLYFYYFHLRRTNKKHVAIPSFKKTDITLEY